MANLTVPLTPIGAGGLASETGALNITVFGAPWTTGTVAIGVTPIRIRTNSGVDDPVPGFMTLTLHFVPEPTTLVLLGTGIAALAMAGQRRAQR